MVFQKIIFFLEKNVVLKWCHFCGAYHTEGVDNKTIDGIKLEMIKKYHKEYVNNQYNPQPVKKVLIPKDKNKTRPLGIPTIKDRIIQKAMEQLLTLYFENIFSEWSFGFRSKKSCHDAVKRVKQRFKGIDYIIKIDIKGYFETINHDILNKMLNKYIRKAKTLKTINQWLKAGIMENGIKYESLSGTPQGGIISPLLSNIYLHYIDKKMEELIRNGKPIMKANPEYWKAYTKKQHHNLSIDSEINLNPNPRIEYIRYADDFIIGIKGEHHEAERIKTQVLKWLEQDLKLVVNRDKSKIVKATKGTRFLSYMVKVNPTNKTRKKKTTKNSLNGQVQIQIPKDTTRDYGKEYGWTKNGKVKHDETLASREALEIIRTYKSITLGIIRYFCLGNNLAQLTHLYYLAEYSCLKTLARKWKTSIAKVRRKLRNGKTWGIQYNLKNKTKVDSWDKLDWEKIKRMRKTKGNPDVIINRYLYQGRTTLTSRLKAERCEVCQTENIPLEIHHTKTVRNSNWQSILNKQTIALCRNCHRKRTNQQINDITQNKKKRMIKIHS
ncbi:Group II intron-encoded protein ltrA (Includes: Reverse-transcriptase) [Strawberry lethal yellows phytoplasma (CPA) str. NZSb11]|uniref:Group II intron-encoded protein ltrA n=1 Tax=Strawberry lethal yellows phytoplasma (CPA) str. NZSb11 TaxID=980422 RepID=R4RQ80_PHYAS|nr:Group II intron-encoded protein ltrA (Includes: Reverse-transcriptase) [Strawberry lethal yellows phytoplasma (CPA) str. NZSb11]